MHVSTVPIQTHQTISNIFCSVINSIVISCETSQCSKLHKSATGRLKQIIWFITTITWKNVKKEIQFLTRQLCVHLHRLGHFSGLGPFSTHTASNQHLAKVNREEKKPRGRKRMSFLKHYTVVRSNDWYKCLICYILTVNKCVYFIIFL